MFAATQFGFKAAQGSLAKAFVEVGHHAHNMGQIDTRIKRCAAFVIDKHKRDFVGAQSCAQAHHKAAQQFTLASPRGSCDQGVRSVARQIDLDDSVGSNTKRSARRWVDSVQCPLQAHCFGQRIVIVCIESEQFDEPHASRNRRGFVGRFGIDETGESC